MTDHRRQIVRTLADAEAIRSCVFDGATRTIDWLRSHDAKPMEFLRALRFDQMGHDPLTCAPLNIIEQLNQTFTILVSLRATEKLIELHPDADGFQLSLGTSSGRDIESVKPDLVAAEVFAATHPQSNHKLNKDIARLEADPALHRYVFFAAPNYEPGRQLDLEKPDTRIQVFATIPF